MPWKTEIALKNNRSDDILCIIPQGMVFENKSIGSGVQNVAASREYRLLIPADSKMTVELNVDCINQSFRPPRGLQGNVTIFVIDHRLSRHGRNRGHQDSLRPKVRPEVIPRFVREPEWGWVSVLANFTRVPWRIHTSAS